MKYDEDTPQEVVEKRKERNRVLARKTRYSFNCYTYDTKPSYYLQLVNRQRKKYFFESLQKQLSQLAVGKLSIRRLFIHTHTHSLILTHSCSLILTHSYSYSYSYSYSHSLTHSLTKRRERHAQEYNQA